ncbi:hypothetical protein RRX38_12335 [Pseudomonas sp. DTU_2021_1001937_2_SI_NGA_ILE_001]|uniref:hypothetical protein n=1 Tax=Pseudomonas sp. DTU_2021_1001937_2_SI_NGA_ILE_001 TaxID=3077589 RepID=UPI0028FC0B2D|nr:hypothetical protein [Pseudomonas sp. DTU_2021_1001937_2_SI_NGA_ILE_001]WNW11905.1 hypothetical protein RRX38_12335 [Pseudomonas sp. DTU_2021_1001937_2_SI_NGA_ILE_001]
MLIQIEEGFSANQWIVKLDDYPVTCRSREEAHAFAQRMQERLDAPHPLPDISATAPQEALTATAH